MAQSPNSLILLPVDGSPSSLRASKHCAGVARAFGARVLLLNVQPEVEDWQTHGIGHQAAIDHLKTLASQALAEPGKALSGEGVAFDTLVEFGEAPAVIARVVKERGCGAIVMGTRGQSELKSLVMGGVGMKVLHLVEVPVTFVH
jgi:nucleotide-binding universal stress UspA family protein